MQNCENGIQEWEVDINFSLTFELYFHNSALNLGFVVMSENQKYLNCIFISRRYKENFPI